MLQVANEAPVYQRLGGMVGVDLTTNLYVGGIDRDNITLNSNVQVYSNFRGCISDVSKTKLTSSYLSNEGSNHLNVKSIHF